MDFYKQTCKSLCEKLVNGKIFTKKHLDEFVEDTRKKYGESSINEEKKILKPLYSVMKDDSTSNEQLDIEYFKNLKKALDELGKFTNLKLFSVFLGIGTGKYYREASKQIEQKIKSLNQPENNSENNIFKGLPNRILQNCCYLNSALQQLYTMESFRTKVMGFEIKNTESLDENQKKLIAVQKIFKHLSNSGNKLSTSELDKLRKDLGHKGKQEDSDEYMTKIQDACKRAMAKKEKTTHKKEETTNELHLNNITLNYLITSSSIDKLLESWIKETIDDFYGKINILKLKVKDDKIFKVSIPRAPDKSIILELGESLTFQNINGYLRIVKNFKDNNEPCNEFKCQLISATVHRGLGIGSGHYYIYKKSGSDWVEINDNKISKRKWKDIKDIIQKNSTVLLYKLVQ